jgi:hypothetical protein
MLLPTWSDFIILHEDNLHLQRECSKLINIFQTSSNRTEKLANITSLQTMPAVVILTLDPFDNNIKSSFFHQTGGPIFRDDGPIKCLALTGFEANAIPIQLNVDQLQSSLQGQEAIHTPSLTALMSTHSEPIDTLKTLLSDESTTRQINKAVVLPPLLTASFLKLLDPDPWEILHDFIKTIHDATPEDTEDDDLTMATLYFPTLLSLWAFCNHTTIPNLYTSRSPAADQASQNWSQNLHRASLKKTEEHTNLPPNNLQTLALDRLAESLAARESRFAAVEDDDKSDTNDLTKRWKKLDKTMREATLFASTPDGLTVPELPSERLLQLVQARNGAIAARLLKRWHPRLDILVQTGMASNISNCTFASQPDEFAVDTFSPFFTPPLRAGFHNISNDELNSLELSSTSFNLLPMDIKKLTSCKPYVATTPTLYKQQLKNFHAVLGDIFTEEALLTQIVHRAILHYEDNEMLYHTIINDDKYFIVWMLSRVHFKIQSILHQCLLATSLDDVHFNAYTLEDELQNIRTFNFTAVAPRWYLNELDKQAEKDRAQTPSKYQNGLLNRYKERPQQDRDKTRTRVDNDNKDNFTTLQSGEKYHWLTHFDNLKKCSHLSVRMNGEFLCNNWHIRGHCTSDCRRRSTHTDLSPDQKANYRKYVAALRKCCGDFRENNFRNRNKPTPKMEDKQGEQNKENEQN